MSDDYLWNKKGEPDPEVEDLERLLARYRHRGGEPPALETPPTRAGGGRSWALPLAAMIALAVGVAAVSWQVLRPEDGGFAVAGLALAGLVVLFLLPLFLRLRPIDHGQPRNYVPDTHVVRAALGMARDKHPVPPVNRYSSYPNLVPYMLLPLYAAHFALGAA